MSTAMRPKIEKIAVGKHHANKTFSNPSNGFMIYSLFNRPVLEFPAGVAFSAGHIRQASRNVQLKLPASVR